MLTLYLSGFRQIFLQLLHLYYIFITKCNIHFFPFAYLPPTLFPSSWSSAVISLVVIILSLFVTATFSATIKGSIKSIKTLAGEDAKFAPGCNNCLKKALTSTSKNHNFLVISCSFPCFNNRLYKIPRVSIIIYIIVISTWLNHSIMSELISQYQGYIF